MQLAGQLSSIRAARPRQCLQQRLHRDGLRATVVDRLNWCVGRGGIGCHVDCAFRGDVDQLGGRMTERKR